MRQRDGDVTGGTTVVMVVERRCWGASSGMRSRSPPLIDIPWGSPREKVSPYSRKSEPRPAILVIRLVETAARAIKTLAMNPRSALAARPRYVKWMTGTKYVSFQSEMYVGGK